MLSLKALSLSLKGTEIIRLSADIAPGEILTVMGPSGSGKSSLLLALIGALPPDFTATGHIELNGRNITELPTAERYIGILFQDDVLFPHLSVLANLSFALPPTPGQSRDARARILEDGLASLDLAGFGPRDPATLSGGQRARVALLRSLLAAPKALLLDEAFSRLDAALRDQTRALVFAEARKRHLPVIMVTHDAEDARAATGRIIDPMGRDLSL
jgi:putative thiamine transport system ATP-binding protein